MAHASNDRSLEDVTAMVEEKNRVVRENYTLRSENERLHSELMRLDDAQLTRKPQETIEAAR